MSRVVCASWNIHRVLYSLFVSENLWAPGPLQRILSRLEDSEYKLPKPGSSCNLHQNLFSAQIYEKKFHCSTVPHMRSQISRRNWSRVTIENRENIEKATFHIFHEWKNPSGGRHKSNRRSVLWKSYRCIKKKRWKITGIRKLRKKHTRGKRLRKIPRFLFRHNSQTRNASRKHPSIHHVWNSHYSELIAPATKHTAMELNQFIAKYIITQTFHRAAYVS